MLQVCTDVATWLGLSRRQLPNLSDRFQSAWQSLLLLACSPCICVLSAGCGGGFGHTSISVVANQSWELRVRDSVGHESARGKGTTPSRDERPCPAVSQPAGKAGKR